MKRKHLTIVAGGILLLGSGAAYAVLSRQTMEQSLARIEIVDGKRVMTSNGIPDHATGKFPNRGNPNTIRAQRYIFRIPVTPRPAASAREPRGMLFGVALNGVPFEPGTGEIWNNDFRYHYEALSGFMVPRGSLGMDQNTAHVQPSGAYHYHGLPFGYLEPRDYKHKMLMIGYAADGYPIYGPYGLVDGKLKELRSSYRLKSGNRPTGDGPQGAYDGSFASDYEYVPGLGDLDQFNGRTGVTPEYPQGTFYYVVTKEFPFVSRLFKGIPDSSFRHRGPMPGSGGPGGGARPDGPPPG